MKVDLGDIVAEFTLNIKGKPEKKRSVWKFGVVRKTVPADRVPVIPQPYSPHSREVTGAMNLQTDKKIEILGMVDFDEMGNEIGPSAEQATYTTDDVAGQFIVLTDNGDGTGVIAATGTPGVAQVTATFANGTTEVEAVNLVVGDVATHGFRFGEPTEVTPDEPLEA